MSNDYTIELRRSGTIGELQSSADAFIQNSSIERTAYIGGPAGCGKTFLVRKAFEGPEWECIFYDCAIIKAKELVGKLASTCLGSAGVLSLMQRRQAKQVVCLDNVGALIAGDKTGANALIRLLRPIKPRRRPVELKCPSFVVCIGGDKEDKKTKELRKHSRNIILSAPTHEMISRILIRGSVQGDHDAIVKHVNRDLRRLNRVSLYASRTRAYRSRHRAAQGSREHTAMLLRKIAGKAPKVNWLLVADPNLVSLLWHENVPQMLEGLHDRDKIRLYGNVSSLLCIGDIVDRVLFQRQLRDSSHLTLFLKCGATGELLEPHINPSARPPEPAELEFTKVLTKYSTAHNNAVFMANAAAALAMDLREVMEQPGSSQQTDVEKISVSDRNRLCKFVEDCNSA